MIEQEHNKAENPQLADETGVDEVTETLQETTDRLLNHFAAVLKEVQEREAAEDANGQIEIESSEEGAHS